MKQFLLFACLSIFTLGLNAQVFVDADATGTGDGTSWANAYTNLNDALLAAAAGSEVWIADGTYTTPDTASFFIDKELTVLGGFNGTESAASEANPATNVTILSGDVLGNDGMTYDSTAAADNNRVLFITDTSDVSQYTVTLDGLTITNGAIAADRQDGDPLTAFTGAGLLSFAKLNASRIIFANNRSTLGSAVGLIFSTANETVLDSITLTGNTSGTNRQVYINSVDSVTIKNSTFIGDAAVTQQSGFIQAAFVNNFTVESCQFADITSAFSGSCVRVEVANDVLVKGCSFTGTTASVGGASIILDSDDVLFQDCTFDNVSASSGGAIYIAQADDFLPDSEEMDGNDFVIDNCTITNGIASNGRGGALWAGNSNLRITNSTITDNRASSIGGAMYLQPADSRDYVVELVKTNISNNTDAGAGGAICLLVFGNDNGTAFVEGMIDGCTFNGNESSGQGRGAALYLQSENNFTITNTSFSENLYGAGTIYTSGDNGVDLKNCDFTDNGDTEIAYRGVITAFFGENAAGIKIDSSSFTGNAVTSLAGAFSGGAAIWAVGGAATSVPMEISNSLFMDNAAADEQSGGALLLLSGFATKINNTEFVGNSADGDGGAISVTIFEATRDTMENGQIDVTYDNWSGEINNSKFINSIAGGQGGAISTQRAGFDMTNNVFVGNSIGVDGFSGGAFIFNGNAPSIDDDGVEVVLGDVAINSVLAHNTFVDNFKGTDENAVGDNIALFMPGDTDNGDSNSMVITLINNAFLLGSGNPSIEVELGQEVPDLGFVPIGNLTVTSLGGNFFNTENGPNIPVFDASTNDIFNDNADYESFFVDLLDDNDMGVNVDLAILGDQGADNPLINSGVTNDLVPATDLRGNPRGDAPDIGAYEAEWGLVDTDQPVDNSGLALSFYPNPTKDVLNIENADATITNFHVLVSDQMGRVLKAAKFNGSVNRLDLSTMPAGVYNLRLYVNGNVYSKQIVKQ